MEKRLSVVKVDQENALDLDKELDELDWIHDKNFFISEAVLNVFRGPSEPSEDLINGYHHLMYEVSRDLKAVTDRIQEKVQAAE